jgi:Domain of unknown function (DUF4160)
VPELNRYRGIVWAFFYRDHGVPHVHVYYSGHVIVLRVSDGQPFEGSMPAKQLKIAKAWIAENVDLINRKWRAAKAVQR